MSITPVTHSILNFEYIDKYKCTILSAIFVLEWKLQLCRMIHVNKDKRYYIVNLEFYHLGLHYFLNEIAQHEM